VKKEKLRSGYTTGACAAAAAKAAALLLLSVEARKCESAKAEDFLTSTLSRFRAEEVEIPFPDGSRIKFRVKGSGFRDTCTSAWASVVKDAGDDPDVTNGAEIVAEVSIVRKRESAEMRKQKTSELPGLPTYELFIKGGRGVGIVTKPGLPVPVGEPAINPVPRRMITEAVMEALESVKARKRESAEEKNLRAYELTHFPSLEIAISVPNGEKLAKRTLNSRLGITGGISILGTTGIVKPISSEAWTATITFSMDVAKAMGHQEIVLSAGRSSEKAHTKKYGLADECYVLMGDYLEYSLQEAKNHGFKKIHICAQWAKMLKIAMATPQTHVRFGAIDIKKAVELLQEFAGASGRSPLQSYEFNTAREIFDYINSKLKTQNSKLYLEVCASAKMYAERIAAGIPVTTHLVSYEGEIITSSE
jgi:cobalt-precorrin-5B (C1)-methyltransferase